MMGISRDLMDLARTGHTCTNFIPVKATQYSVFVNGKPALRMGDPCLPHTINVGPFCYPCPMPTVKMGSFKVFVKGIPVARFLDWTDLGMLIMGSTDVHAG